MGVGSLSLAMAVALYLARLADYQWRRHRHRWGWQATRSLQTRSPLRCQHALRTSSSPVIKSSAYTCPLDKTTPNLTSRTRDPDLPRSRLSTRQAFRSDKVLLENSPASASAPIIYSLSSTERGLLLSGPCPDTSWLNRGPAPTKTRPAFMQRTYPISVCKSLLFQ